MRDVEAIAALGGLAQEDRLAAFRLLMEYGSSGLPSGAIAEQLKVPPTRMSFHLTTLERAGLLKATREGRHIRYAVDYAAMRQLLAFLIEDCCSRAPEMCGFAPQETAPDLVPDEVEPK